MSRRTAVTVGLVAVLALPSAAWAHGELRPGRAPARTTVEAVLLVPSEREGRTNSHIAVALPPGFAALGCGAPSGWTCTTTDKGAFWRRVTGLAPAEEFGLRMLVSDRPGSYVLPLGQTYDDGETRTFAAAPGRRDEGPVFTVSGAVATPSPAAAASPAASSAGGEASRLLAELPVGRRLEPPSSDGGSALLVGLGVVGGTALLGTLLLLRRRRPDEQA